MEAQELLGDFSKRINIEYDGGAAIAFEADGLPVAINILEENNEIALTGDIGAPPPEKLEGLYKTLLSANHQFAGTAGATLSLDPENGRIRLCRTVSEAIHDAESFCKEVENFINTAETWAKLVSNYRDAVPASATADDTAPSLPATGFMQV